MMRVMAPATAEAIKMAAAMAAVRAVPGGGGGGNGGRGNGKTRGSGGKNVIFSNGPNSIFECFNLL